MGPAHENINTTQCSSGRGSPAKSVDVGQRQWLRTMLRHFCNRFACVTGTLAAAPDSHSRGGCYTIRTVSMHGHARQAHTSLRTATGPVGNARARAIPVTAGFQRDTRERPPLRLLRHPSAAAHTGNSNMALLAFTGGPSQLSWRCWTRLGTASYRVEDGPVGAAVNGFGVDVVTAGPAGLPLRLSNAVSTSPSNASKSSIGPGGKAVL